MRIVFLGTPEFAVPSLKRLHESGHDIAAVYTQPDRPAGRKQELMPPPVKQAAASLGLLIRQPEKIRRPEVIEEIRQLQPEVMVVVGYGQILPQSLIDIPPLGIVNVHASLLPKYRGAAPIQWAIARGETVTGVTTMLIDAGLDTGDILLARQTPIGPEETAEELSARLAVLGADLLVETLEGLRAGTIVPRPQDHSQATLAPLLKKEDGRIDWRLPAREIFNRARAFVPWPGAYTEFRGGRLHIWRCRPAEPSLAGPPGLLKQVGRRLLVACGDGASLELLEIQQEGRKRMSAEAFLNGVRLSENEKLGVTS
jgi:methionyl-tRNA formyltransferase